RRSCRRRTRDRPREHTAESCEEDKGDREYKCATTPRRQRDTCQRDRCHRHDARRVGLHDGGGDRRAAKRGQQRCAVGGACGRTFRERRAGQRGELRVGGRIERRNRRRRPVAVHVDQCERVVGDEGQRRRQHAEQEDAEGVHVACRRRRLAARLLRRDVGRGAEHRSRLGQGSGPDHVARQAEVGQLDAILLVEEDVRRLEVAMDEAAVVQMRETGGDSRRDPAGFVIRERPACFAEPFFERPARQPLERHERPGRVLAVVVDAHHVLVTERRNRPRLAPETLEIGARIEHLQCHRSVERVVVCTPHLGHRSAAGHLLEAVAVRDLVSGVHEIRYSSIVDSLLTFEQAQEKILAAAHPLSAELVPLAEAAGRVLAEDVRAVTDLPPFPSSAMDGYAVRAADLPGALNITGESAAGAPFAGTVGPGEAVAISTGAVVPEGADAVAPVEIVVKIDNRVEVDRELAFGASVRPRGGDVRAGDIVLAAGTRLGAAAVAGLGAAGIGAVSCTRRPRVAVLATGTELVPPGTPLEPGQIYESNTLMLAAALSVVGAEIITAPAVPDDEASLRVALERALACDVLVTSGGVSVGEHDLVRKVEQELGVEEIFWRVAIKPGKPLAFGTRGATLVFGLPGNPVSALVSAELFVKPALRALQGTPAPLPRFEPGRLAGDMRLNAERDEFVRARARIDEDAIVLEPLRGQESHMIASASTADALVHIPRGNGELSAGSVVSWLRLNAP
ncbi:MAG TPA: gephyrin-like molybdotransferase Glp, partial [Candidatus Elarobacter sp.]